MSNVFRLFSLGALLWTPALHASEPGAVALFNGKDLSGWAQVGPGGFTVENGLLKTQGGMGLLWYTEKKFQDAVLRVVYRQTTREANGGIFIRLPEPPRDPWHAVHTGYEVQILEVSDYPSFDEYHRTGALYSIARADSYPASADGWNVMEITLDGPRTTVHINGVQVTDYREGEPVPPKRYRYEPERGLRPEAGYIGLQNHNDDSVLYFREVSIRPLKK